MLVRVTSACQGVEGRKSRSILDLFLPRDGRRTWQGDLSEEGLICLREELSLVAGEKTALAAFSVDIGGVLTLEWSLGRAFHFDEAADPAPRLRRRDRVFTPTGGKTACAATLPLILELAGLWHDLGKANPEFQKKLRTARRLADAVRHEIISCRLFVETISLLLSRSRGDLSKVEGAEVLAALTSVVERPLLFRRNASNVAPAEDICPEHLPEPLRAVAWLVATHHRLLDASPLREGSPLLAGRSRLTHHINDDRFEDGVAIRVEQGILCRDFAERTARLLRELSGRQAAEIGWGEIAGYGRLSLILADRLVSRQAFDQMRHGEKPLAEGALIANLDDLGQPKQLLLEHLEKVGDGAPETLADIDDFLRRAPALPSEGLPKVLREPSRGRFAWQGRAAEGIAGSRRRHAGFFGLLMAGTGSGKTRACPRILAAAGSDLRYTLLNSLRSLTLQTGTAYRKELGLSESEVAVLIGSAAVQHLYEKSESAPGSESSRDPFIGFEVDAAEKTKTAAWRRLPAGIRRHVAGDGRAARFLAAPVLVSTVDQMMAVADQRRTNFVMAALRLASSDLVLDEVDNYSEEDLVAIGRLVFMAGLFGCKVLLASATLPPTVGEAFFQAYRRGFLMHSKALGRAAEIDVGFLADAGETVRVVAGERPFDFSDAYRSFRWSLIDAIAALPINCKAELMPERSSLRENFVDLLAAAATIHESYHETDARTGMRCSAILTRFSHVKSCVAYARWLAEEGRSWAESQGISLKVIVYHGAHPLLVRSEIEGFLDRALKRRPDRFLAQPEIRSWMAGSGKKNHILLVVSTAAEEIGRDHDFDGAVAEVSGLASLIQMRGRIWRHREKVCTAPNLYLLPSSLRRLSGKQGLSFAWPGVESHPIEALQGAQFRLPSSRLCDLLDPKFLEGVSAVPALGGAGAGKLGDLERDKLHRFLLGQGYYTLAGFIDEKGAAFLAARHAGQMRFRRGQPEVALWYHPGAGQFFERDDDGRPRPCSLACDRGDVLGDLRLLDLDPARLLEVHFPELSVEERAEHARLYFQLQVNEERLARGDLIYQEDLGIYQPIEV